VRSVGAAWDLVAEAAGRAGVHVVDLSDPDDADRVRSIVDRVWGAQTPPRELITAMQLAGSVLCGAERDGELVGFVWGFLGLAGGLHLHSHMLGVLPEWQSLGVGYALKLAQRATCLDQGIAGIRWTFDPLGARNARLNLVKLGAQGVRFLPEFYGEMTDRLNREDRSDRFEVRWALDADRTVQALAGRPSEAVPTEWLLVADGDPAEPRPRRTNAVPGPGVAVAVPRDYLGLKSRRPDLAATWRAATSEPFQACFDAGLIATWLTSAAEYVFDLPERP
jgi:predicted GNAT superfamily acetyltransferase